MFFGTPELAHLVYRLLDSGKFSMVAMEMGNTYRTGFAKRFPDQSGHLPPHP